MRTRMMLVTAPDPNGSYVVFFDKQAAAIFLASMPVAQLAVILPVVVRGAN